jgi:hypothetical protein
LAERVKKLDLVMDELSIDRESATICTASEALVIANAAETAVFLCVLVKEPTGLAG